ncbi:hypothetical protein O3G_MSEX006127, partial [Manduca sexta]
MKFSGLNFTART